MTNAVEWLHEEFSRRIKTQCVLPSAVTAAMFFWALMASGQIIVSFWEGQNPRLSGDSFSMRLAAISGWTIIDMVHTWFSRFICIWCG